MPHKALFLDRDGTINIDKHYVYQIKDFEFEKGACEALKFFYEKGYFLFIVTNQSGIARGYFSLNDLNTLNNYIYQEAKKNKFEFKDIAFCPHHENGIIPKYKQKCLCRKPENLLIEQLITKYNIDRQSSYFIGDKVSDIKAGIKSKLKTVLVGTGEGKKTKEKCHTYNIYVDNLLSLTKKI